MKQKILFILIFTIFLINLNARELNLKYMIINITDDGGEWPPYTYYERLSGKHTNRLIGYSLDVIDEIFKKNGIRYTIELLPWKRAQREVESGNNYQMFLSGTYSKERDEKYYISLPYYSTKGYYFYSKKKYPNGLDIDEIGDLKKYKAAGLLGHNYTDYGFDEKSIYLGAQSYESIMHQIELGYYDIFLESLEILTGYSLVNDENIITDEIGYERVPDMEPVYFYMMFTKNELGKKLKEIVDKGIEEMEKSGRLKEIMGKYVKE